MRCDPSERSSTLAAAGLPLRQSVVFHQLDDLNALGDALAAAAGDDDPERLATISATLDRYTVAAGWHADAAWPAILTYVEAHASFPEDLFAPAFLLQAIAPDRAETTALLARLSQPVRDLLALATRRCPARP